MKYRVDIKILDGHTDIVAATLVGEHRWPIIGMDKEAAEALQAFIVTAQAGTKTATGSLPAATVCVQGKDLGPSGILGRPEPK